jgi:hypothetical protein
MNNAIEIIVMLPCIAFTNDIISNIDSNNTNANNVDIIIVYVSIVFYYILILINFFVRFF